MRPWLAMTTVACALAVLASGCGKKDEEAAPKKTSERKRAVVEADVDDELEAWEAERAARRAKRQAADEPGGAPKAATGVSAGVKVTPEDELLRGKLGDFSDAIHRCAPQVRQSNSSYREWVDPEKGPTGDEDIIYGIAPIPAADACILAIGRGLDKRTASLDLDSAATRVKSALSRLDPLVQQAHKYYEDKEYQNDRMAKGNSLHENLMAAFDGWFAALLEMRAAMDKADTALSERGLGAVLDKFGKGHKYLFRTWQYRCRRLAEVVADGDRTADALQHTVGPCRVAIEDLLALGAGKEEPPINKVDLPKWRHFLEQLQPLHTETKALAQQLLDGKPLPEDGETSPAHVAKVWKQVELAAAPLGLYL